VNKAGLFPAPEGGKMLNLMGQKLHSNHVKVFLCISEIHNYFFINIYSQSFISSLYVCLSLMGSRPQVMLFNSRQSYQQPLCSSPHKL
jgi:hypothetical protein